MDSAFHELVPLNPKEYNFTESGNIISRFAGVYGAQNIIIHGKCFIAPYAIIRGDLRRIVGPPTGSSTSALMGQATSIQVGRYLNIGQRSVLRPPCKNYKGAFNYHPMRIGDWVTIGEDCVVEAAQIGSGTEIQDNCIVGKFCIIKEYVLLVEGTVLSPNTICPNLTVWSGNPGQMIDYRPEVLPELIETKAKARYRRYKAVKSERAEPRIT